MPGYVRDRFPDLSAEDRDDYTCSICQEIFNTPVTTTCCRQTFCEDCITQWLQTNTTCPYDRKPLTTSQLYQPSRAMANTLGRFRIRCDYWTNGCREVIKLDDLPQHTANCRYKSATCAKCDGTIIPGHDCIEVLRAKIETLRVVNKLLTKDHDHSTQSEPQLLDECRRHLSAPVVLDNTMSADMTDKTLAILRQQLTEQNSVYFVCRHVCEGLDLEYDSEWHCTADWRGGYVGRYLQGLLNWPVLKARLKHKKITRKLNEIDTNMNASMVSVVTDIVFEAIDRSDTMIHTVSAKDNNNMTKRCEYWDNGCRQVVTQCDLKEHTDNCRYQRTQCLQCHCVHIWGHNCIETMRADILALKLADNDAKSDHGDNSGHDILSIHNQTLSDDQILAECRRHLLAHVVIYNTMNADMTDKTLSIIRKQLRKQSSVYEVCKRVAQYMDLQFGTDWHCLADLTGDSVAYFKSPMVKYFKVKYTPMTFTLFYSKKFDLGVLKARIRHNTIIRKLDIIRTDMNESMQSVVTDIVFEAIKQTDTMNDTMTDIKVKMQAKYPAQKWRVYLVCKHVCECLDLEYDSEWHCTADWRGGYIGHYMDGQLNWLVLKARLKHKKITRKLNEIETNMDETMVSVVTGIMFDGIDRSDTMIDAVAKDNNNITERYEYWDNGCRQVVKQSDLKKHTVNCRYKRTQCSKCHCVHRSGHDCIESLRADILALKLADNNARSGHGNNSVNGISSINNHMLSEDQILAECRQHLSAPVVIYNIMSVDMTDKTLSIIRKQLRKQSSVYEVCKRVAQYMDLQFGTDWHCLADLTGDSVAYFKSSMVKYLKVKYTPMAFTLFYSKKLDLEVLKGRIMRKLSRETRRAKDNEIAIREVFAKQENLKLRCEIAQLMTEMTKLRCHLNYR
ncbi:unnamed protein product [Medioppia subpectinata]|uniref:RING-type domain-containing protein n=1 Tax=Medioppia subpectinata TaxID=1979941 RepID=A0A7R9PV75_9ACAR|nr:unnamed protein product [Medioppia subpectinata]CAG2101571.1 unnamed protein product [Medioppia subpectinata]